MRITTIALAAALCTATTAGVAHAQWANMDINAMNAQMNAQMNAAMQQRQNGIIQQNLNDPRVMAGYQAWLARGNRGTPQQYAYQYAATGGFTPQGMRNYYDTSNRITQQQQQGWRGVQEAERARGQAQVNMQDRYYANSQEAGRGLMGNQTYYDPTNGANVQLRYIQPGQSYTDYATGRTYAMDGNGQYWSTSGNGYWSQVNPAARSPMRSPH